jgi:uroporphyrinogen-III synthase
LVPWVWKHASLEQARIPLTQGFAAAVSFRRAPIAISENSRQGSTFRTWDRWSRDPGETFVSVPFLSRTRLMGAITLQHLRPRPYTGQELRLLVSIGQLVGAELRILDLENEKSELLLEQETRKMVERGKGTLERELGLSEQEAH